MAKFISKTKVFISYSGVVKSKLSYPITMKFKRTPSTSTSCFHNVPVTSCPSLLPSSRVAKPLPLVVVIHKDHRCPQTPTLAVCGDRHTWHYVGTCQEERSKVPSLSRNVTCTLNVKQGDTWLRKVVGQSSGQCITCNFKWSKFQQISNKEGISFFFLRNDSCLRVQLWLRQSSTGVSFCSSWAHCITMLPAPC